MIEKFPVLEIEPDPKDIPLEALGPKDKIIALLEANIKDLRAEIEYMRGELKINRSKPIAQTIIPKPTLRTTSEIQKALEKFHALKDPKMKLEIREEEK